MVGIGDWAISANLRVQILQVKLDLFVEEFSITVNFLLQFDNLAEKAVEASGELIIHFWK